nr:MAG TPA: hypothetical protein [Caudoviricetes sp.]
MSRYYNDYLQHSDEDTLAHFGVPGMKWGQRKSLAEVLEDRREARDDRRRKSVQRFTRMDSKILKRIQNFKKNTDPSKLNNAQRKNLQRTEQYYLDKKAGKAVYKKGIFRKMNEAQQFMSRKEYAKVTAATSAGASAVQTFLMNKAVGNSTASSAKLAGVAAGLGAASGAASGYVAKSLSRWWGANVTGKAIG